MPQYSRFDENRFITFFRGLYSKINRIHIIGFGITLVIAFTLIISLSIKYHRNLNGQSFKIELLKRKVGKISESLKWVPMKTSNVSVEGAYIADYRNNEPLYVCRVFDRNAYLPAEYTKSSGACYLARNSQIRRFGEFELLVADESKLEWSEQRSPIPFGSIIAGFAPEGEVTIIRQTYENRIGWRDPEGEEGWVASPEDYHHNKQYQILCVKDVAFG